MPSLNWRASLFSLTLRASIKAARQKHRGKRSLDMDPNRIGSSPVNRHHHIHFAAPN
jgi:hypothetical protein